MRRAQLIFEGEVVDVGYRSSQRTLREAGLAHTFVRFRVGRVLKGRVEGEELVLRFLGGEDAAEGEFFTVEQPLFDAGDRDVLLVEGNLRKACPLVRCLEGRFRLIRGLVFDEDGHEVVAHPREAVAYGRFHALPETQTHFVLGTVLRLVTAGETGEEEPSLADAGPQFREADFLDFLARRVLDLHNDEELAALEPVPSADSSEPFRVAPPRPRRFAAARPAPRPPFFLEPPTSLEDFLERLLVWLNGDDPRLGPRAVRLLERIRSLESRGAR